MRVKRVAKLPQRKRTDEYVRSSRQLQRGARQSRGPLFLLVVAPFLAMLPMAAPRGDTTLETDTEALAQIFFALGGPGWP